MAMYYVPGSFHIQRPRVDHTGLMHAQVRHGVANCRSLFDVFDILQHQLPPTTLYTHTPAFAMAAVEEGREEEEETHIMVGLVAKQTQVFVYHHHTIEGGGGDICICLS